MPILLFLLIALLIGVGVFYGNRQAAARRDALAALAARRGWAFEPDRDRSFDDRFPHFAPFRRGSSRFAHNTIAGCVEGDRRRLGLTMGDYHYQTHSTDSKGRRKTQTHRFSYLIVHSPHPPTPKVSIRPEGFFDSIAAFFGADDIDFESVEFSRRFHVTSDDKRFAYDLVTPAMMEFFLQASPNTVELAGRDCLVMHGKKRWEPEEFESTVLWAEHFFARWPEHLVDQLAGRG